MKTHLVLMAALAIASPAASESAAAQEEVEAHVTAARRAAGEEYTALFERLCGALSPAPPSEAPSQGAPSSDGPPDRALWYADPVKVFDNLYFVGQTEYSAWAVTTSEGIIVIDPIFDYSVEEEVVNGLAAMGLDPSTIRYVVVSHGHLDHAGGARYLQDRFGATVVMSAADWDLVEQNTGSWPKPHRDMVATDGQQLELGDTTLTLHLTPGHTLGTISTVIPIKDAGMTHTAVLWGGTAFNWIRNPGAYITPNRPASFWFRSYSGSARRFREIARHAGADVLLSNHLDFDGSKAKLPAVLRRLRGEPHPYVVGPEGVERYLKVAEECAEAGLAGIRG